MFDHRWLAPAEVESMRRLRSSRRTCLERHQAAVLRDIRRHHRRERSA